MASQIFYGGYELRPVPFVEVRKNYLKQGDQITRGVTFSLTLQGTIAIIGNGGIEEVMDKQRELRTAFNGDGKLFQIVCDSTVLLECHPRVLNVEFSNSRDNWVYTSPYTITIEYEHDPANVDLTGIGEDVLLHPEYISDFQESWNIQFVQDRSNPYSIDTTAGDDDNPYVMQVSHEVSAVGKAHWIEHPTVANSGILEKQAWEQARDYIVNSGYLGFDEEVFLAQSVLNLETGTWSTYDHYRVVTPNKTAGSFQVQENWLVLANNARIDRKALEDFTVEVNTDINAEFDTVSIQGTIEGLEERKYTGSVNGDGFLVSGYKYSNATGYYHTIKEESLIYPRVAAIATQHDLVVNSTPLSVAVGHNPNQGTVTYAYNYDTRPPVCISNAKTESIDIEDNNPTDVFASLQIMGRTQGPILQSFNTVTEFTRTVNISALMPPYTGVCEATGFLSGGFYPGTQVETLLCGFETQLEGLYGAAGVLKSADSQSWSPRTGRFSRSVTWTAVPCSWSPSTSLC